MKKAVLSLVAFSLLSCGISVCQPATEKIPGPAAQDTSHGSEKIIYDHVRPDITPPKAIYQPQPEYADRPRKKKIQGTVLLSIVVTEEGTVRDPQVTKSLDKDLDRQAILAVSKWRFQPSTKDGKPVAVRIVIETNFRLY